MGSSFLKVVSLHKYMKSIVITQILKLEFLNENRTTFFIIKIRFFGVVFLPGNIYLD